MAQRVDHSDATAFTYQVLLSSFHQFLIILTHTILYHRRVYPVESFKLVKFYDIAVYQNRHPELCEYIQEMVLACMDAVESVSWTQIIFSNA